MFEVTHAGEEHGDSFLVGFLDGVLIADAPTRLNDGADTIMLCLLYCVVEGEESVGCQYQAFGGSGGFCLFQGDAC